MSEKDETIETGFCVKENTSVQMGGIVTDQAAEQLATVLVFPGSKTTTQKTD